MNLSPEFIIAVTGFVAGLYAAISNYRTSKSGARRDEVIMLREEVGRLQERVIDLETDRSSLHERLQEMTRENQWLRKILREAGISIPPVPEDFLWGRAEGERANSDDKERRKSKR